MLVMQLATFSLRAFVAVVFITYGISKLQNLPGFGSVIRKHQIIPDTLSPFMAATLPPLEIGLGLLFLFNISPILVGIAISATLALFTAILIRALLKPNLPVRNCGCSSSTKSTSSIKGALLRNAMLLIAASAVAITNSKIALDMPFSIVLLEVVVLSAIGIYAAVVQTGFLQRRGVYSQQNRGSEVARRSFLRLGVGVVLASCAAFLVNRPEQAFAYAGCPCGCYPFCYDIQNCSGCPIEGPVYEECDYYCCTNADYCDSTLKFIGYAVC